MAHILLLEPDNVLADLYGAGLRRAGHRVSRTADAQAAVLIADEQRPDVVVLELQLAGHNGVEFLYEFRSYPEWASVPVIVLSTVPDSSLSPLLQAQLGVAAYHYKPRTTLKQLLGTLERLAIAA